MAQTFSIALGVVIAAAALHLATFAWNSYKDHTRNPYLPPEGATASAHLLLDNREWDLDAIKKLDDRIKDLEARGYRFKGTYSAGNVSYLVYERD